MIPGEPPPDQEKLSPARPRPLLPPKPKSLLLSSHPTRSEKQMTHNLTEHYGAEPVCRRRLPHALLELSRYYVQPRRDLRNSLQDTARASPLGNMRSRETRCTLHEVSDPLRSLLPNLAMTQLSAKSRPCLENYLRPRFRCLEPA